MMVFMVLAKSVLIVMSLGDMHSPSSSKDLMNSSQELERLCDLRKIIIYLNENSTLKVQFMSIFAWLILPINAIIGITISYLIRKQF